MKSSVLTLMAAAPIEPRKTLLSLIFPLLQVGNEERRHRLLKAYLQTFSTDQ